MTKEENILEQQFGKENPFRVPEGYFDNFADMLMSQLPEQKLQVVGMRRSRFLWISHVAMVAAACLVSAFFTVVFWLNDSDRQHPHAVATSSVSYSNDVDEMADYTMMDNQDFYAYVSADF